MTTPALAALRHAGFAFVDAVDMGPALGPLPDWDVFAASWNDLELDGHMADGGRYRRRRHAHYLASPAGITRGPHAPHFQALTYNALNGGIERWFAPITDAVAASASLTTILGWAHAAFSAQAPAVTAWAVEVHQFRIEARAGEHGQPTPEGLHRDGVDYVLVLLIGRRNIAQGTTTVHEDGVLRGSFTLTTPLDAALVEDARMQHGVTAVEPVDASAPAFRDVLVVTFRALR